MHAQTPGELPSGVLTFLFTDIEGSTQLHRELGDRYLDVLERHDSIVRRNLSQWNGREVGTAGDSFFAVFTDATDALLAALAMQQELQGVSGSGESRLRVRMGLHTGEAVARDGNYVSLAVSRGARVAAAAHGGQILGTAQAVDAAGALPPTVRANELGSFWLRDFDEPARLFQVWRDGLVRSFPPPRAASTSLTNLPTRSTSFVGRGSMLQQIEAEVAAGRCVTVVGPGGVGKTTTAVEVARGLAPKHPGGVWLVELGDLSDPELVAAAIANVVAPTVAKGGDPSAAVARASTAPTLLVLDNCEHLIEACAVAVDSILAATSCVAILVTSREPLRVPGETVVRLDPMTVPAPDVKTLAEVTSTEAGRLFLERARLSAGPLDLTDEDAGSVARVITELDGLPLAIELAAARLPELGVRDLVDSLADKLTLLAHGPRTVPQRQRTLQSALEWSYNLLAEPERSLFADLSIFASSFDAYAVREVLRPGSPIVQIVDTLAQLARRSLLIVHGTDRARYRMLETVRAYAEHLAQGRSSGLRRRHFAWSLELARSFNARYDIPPEEDEAHASLSTRREDLRTALAWGLEGAEERVGLIEIALAYARLVEDSFDRDEARAFLRLAVRDAEGAEIGLLAHAFRHLGRLAWLAGDDAAAVTDSEHAMDLAEQMGDRALVARCLNNVAAVLHSQSRYDDAERILAKSAAIAHELGDTDLAAYCLGHQGVVARLRGDYVTAAAYQGKALTLARAAGNTSLVVGTLRRLAGLAWAEGDYETADRLNKEALAGMRDEDLTMRAGVLGNLAWVAWARGDHELAEEYFGEALQIAQRLRLTLHLSDYYLGLARLRRDAGQLPDAARYLSTSYAAEQSINNPAALTEIVEEAAVLASRQGRTDDARRLALAARSARTALGRVLERPLSDSHGSILARLTAVSSDAEPILTIEQAGKLAGRIAEDLAGPGYSSRLV